MPLFPTITNQHAKGGDTYETNHTSDVIVVAAGRSVRSGGSGSIVRFIGGRRLIDSIRRMLEQAPVQEKVYLHLDNNCYYKGDTIWYKSYVVRADNLDYTDMSHILYVELLSPDGLVVERQNIIVSPDGYGDGNFTLKDSLYSGYYELRAYTRWMLNFRVTEHSYGRKDREYFYNRQMARDFFRQFGTVYSRVVPVYERPDSAGDYAQKYIVSRPKTRIEKELKESLKVDFYPEGGHLIAGTRCRVAFEVHDEEGQQVDIEGAVRIPGRSDSPPIKAAAFLPLMSRLMVVSEPVSLITAKTIALTCLRLRMWAVPCYSMSPTKRLLLKSPREVSPQGVLMPWQCFAEGC